MARATERERFSNVKFFVVYQGLITIALLCAFTGQSLYIQEFCVSFPEVTVLYFTGCIVSHSGSNQELHDDATEGCGLSPWELHYAQG